MLKKTLELFEIKNFNCGMKLTSELPHGKGMASSSADLAAVAKAVALFFGKEISAEKIAALATSIEPTDGIFFSGVVAMNPVTGQFLKNILVPENYAVAIFDYGGEVDTLKFNRRSNFQIAALDENLSLELVEESALFNQQILYKKNLREIISFAKNIGAVTVNAAHSGTVIGIFFHNDDKNINAKISEIERRFEFIKFLTTTHLTGGGIFEKV
jgi:L-threonine kinase